MIYEEEETGRYGFFYKRRARFWAGAQRHRKEKELEVGLRLESKITETSLKKSEIMKDWS